MPDYAPDRDDIETIDPDERETHAKIIQTMTDGQHISREKYGKSVRISHAKAHGLLKGELIVSDELPPEFARGLFQPGAKHPVVIRLATAPGEYTDDSKLSTVRGMSIKVTCCSGPGNFHHGATAPPVTARPTVPGPLPQGRCRVPWDGSV